MESIEGEIRSIITEAGFQARTAQVEIATQCFTPGVYVNKAPTATGKSLAHLSGAIAAVHQNPGTRALIAVPTILLQDQYRDSDIPSVQGAAKARNVSIHNVKGANNYFCVNKALASITMELNGKPGLERAKQLKVLKEVVQKAQESRHYLKEDALTALQTEHLLTSTECDLLRADTEFCDNDSCKGLDGEVSQCGFQIARTRAKEADVVVTNHTLAVYNMLYGEHLLGHFDYIIFDESHKLNNIYDQHLSKTITTKAFSRLYKHDLLTEVLHDHGETQESLECYLKSVRPKDPQPPSAKADKDSIQVPFPRLSIDTDLLDRGVTAFEELAEDLESRIRRTSDLAPRDRTALHSMVRSFENAAFILQVFVYYSETGYTTDIYNLTYEETVPKSDERIQYLACITSEAEAEGVKSWSDRCTLKVRDLETAKFSNLITSGQSVIFSSATPGSASDPLDLMRKLGFSEDNVTLCELDNGFDYASNQTFHQVRPEGSKDTRRINQLFDIIDNTDGGVLILTTSHKEKTALYNELKHKAELGRKVFCQQSANNKAQNKAEWQKFMDDEQSIMVGLDSFSEGVNAPGKTLSTVVFWDMPWTNRDSSLNEVLKHNLSLEHDDPGHTFDKTYKTPELERYIEQGVGRLLRSPEDTGDVYFFMQPSSKRVSNVAKQRYLYSTCIRAVADAYNTPVA